MAVVAVKAGRPCAVDVLRFADNPVAKCVTSCDGAVDNLFDDLAVAGGIVAVDQILCGDTINGFGNFISRAVVCDVHLVGLPRILLDQMILRIINKGYR